MVKKRINYRLLIIFLILIILIICFIVPKNYKKEYKVNDYIIKETFNNNRYNLSVSRDNEIYDMNFNSKYIGKKVVNNIETIEKDESKCIILNIKDMNKMPLCIKNSEHISYYLIDNIDLSMYYNQDDYDEKTLDNITTYNLLDKKYLIWNYKNFTYIDNNKNKTIDIFKNDQYKIDLATQINNYLVIPNYDEEYNFKELYIININNLNVDKWNLNMDVSYDSYVVGTYDNYIYLVDKKNKVEYEFDIKAKRFKTVGNENKNGIIYKNNSKENISMVKLLNNKISFEYNSDQSFIIDNNKLYLQTSNNKILVSNNNISKIIYQTNNYVYYLIEDTLYYYDIFNGEKKIMKYFEWNFNNDNMIFIY